MEAHPAPSQASSGTPFRAAFWAWLHQGTTILGIAACGSALSAWLLDQATPKQAMAMAIGGMIAIAMKQANAPVTVPVLVQGGQTTVQADTATVQPAAGSTTTVRT